MVSAPRATSHPPPRRFPSSRDALGYTGIRDGMLSRLPAVAPTSSAFVLPGVAQPICAPQTCSRPLSSLPGETAGFRAD